MLAALNSYSARSPPPVPEIRIAHRLPSINSLPTLAVAHPFALSFPTDRELIFGLDCLQHQVPLTTPDMVWGCLLTQCRFPNATRLSHPGS